MFEKSSKSKIGLKIGGIIKIFRSRSDEAAAGMLATVVNSLEKKGINIDKNLCEMQRDIDAKLKLQGALYKILNDKGVLNDYLEKWKGNWNAENFLALFRKELDLVDLSTFFQLGKKIYKKEKINFKELSLEIIPDVFFHLAIKRKAVSAYIRQMLEYNFRRRLSTEDFTAIFNWLKIESERKYIVRDPFFEIEDEAFCNNILVTRMKTYLIQRSNIPVSQLLNLCKRDIIRLYIEEKKLEIPAEEICEIFHDRGLRNVVMSYCAPQVVQAVLDRAKLREDEVDAFYQTLKAFRR